MAERVSKDLCVRPAGGFRAGLRRIGHENPHHYEALRALEAGMALPCSDREQLVELIDTLIARIDAAGQR